MINKFKIVLDILMSVLMVLLMKTEFLGLQKHEIIGLTIFILFFVHKILNFKFVKVIGKNIFNKKMKLKSKIMFMLDILLFIFMFINVLTGVLISKFVLIGITTSNIDFVTLLHKFFAWWTLILIAIHVGLHLDRLVMFISRKIKILKDNQIIKYVILIMYIIFLILGVRSLFKYSIYSKIFLINNDKEVILEKNLDSSKNDIDKNNDNEDSFEDEENDSSEEYIPTLDEYLSQFHCDGCRKNCSLLNPKCEVGRRKREEKIKEYYEIYNNNKSEERDTLNVDSNNDTTPSINNKNNNNSIDVKCKNKSNILDIINIIILFAGGTYYINELLKNKSRK